MNRAFRTFDKDNDGKLTKNDLYQGLKKQMTKQQAKKKVKSIFSNLDVN